METPRKNACPHCHEPNQSTAQKCYLCGTNFGAGRHLNVRKALATIVGLLLLFVVLPGMALRWRSAHRGAVAKKSVGVTGQARAKAYQCARIYVKSKLHVRSKPHFSKDTDPAVSISRTGSTYCVTGWVEAPHRHGSGARKSWRVQIKSDGKGNMRPLSVGID